MSDMYYLPPNTKKDPGEFCNYAAYVDDLRARYSVRIEVTCLDTNIITQLEFKNKVNQYLSSYLGAGTYENQIVKYNALSYVWFTHSEDAIVFMLAYNGKRV